MVPIPLFPFGATFLKRCRRVSTKHCLTSYSTLPILEFQRLKLYRVVWWHWPRRRSRSPVVVFRFRTADGDSAVTLFPRQGVPVGSRSHRPVGVTKQQTTLESHLFRLNVVLLRVDLQTKNFVKNLLRCPIKMRVFHQNESCLSCFHPPASYEGRREQGRQILIR